MKTLEAEFIANYDKTGNHNFKLLKRNENVALYKRSRPTGELFAYEVFRIRTVKEGTLLPGGTKVAESYEKYPYKNGFGKWGKCCKFLDKAENYFDSITNELKVSPPEDILDADDETVTIEATTATVSAGKRGRKAIDRSIVVFPESQFTMKHLAELNPKVSQGFLYVHLRSLIGVDYKVDGTFSQGKGKPTVLYSKINRNN